MFSTQCPKDTLYPAGGFWRERVSNLLSPLKPSHPAIGNFTGASLRRERVGRLLLEAIIPGMYHHCWIHTPPGTSHPLMFWSLSGTIPLFSDALCSLALLPYTGRPRPFCWCSGSLWRVHACTSDYPSCTGYLGACKLQQLPTESLEHSAVDQVGLPDHLLKVHVPSSDFSSSETVGEVATLAPILPFAPMV